MNAKSVHLSNALLGWSYGKDFTYDEMIMLPGAEDADSAREAADANIWSNVVRALQIDLKPGEGPSEAELARSEEHTSELQSLMRISYAVYCLKKKKKPH